jgi:hypothetical protein
MGAGRRACQRWLLLAIEGQAGQAIRGHMQLGTVDEQLLEDAADLIDFLQVPARTQGEGRQLESFGMLATRSQHQAAIGIRGLAGWVSLGGASMQDVDERNMWPIAAGMAALADLESRHIDILLRCVISKERGFSMEGPELTNLLSYRRGERQTDGTSHGSRRPTRACLYHGSHLPVKMLCINDPSLPLAPSTPRGP